MQYVKLQDTYNGRKTPTKDQGYDLAQIQSHKWNYGRRIEKGYVVFDFDSHEIANVIDAIVKVKQLKCKRLITDHGMQYMFKTNRDNITDGSKLYNWLGLEGDIKGVGLHDTKTPGYQAIKVLGVERQEDYYGGATNDEELDYAPKYMYKASKKRQVNLMEDQTGSRNSMFHGEMMIEMRKAGFSYIEYAETAHIINDYVLPEGLPESELNTAIREDEWDKLEDSTDKPNLLPMALDVIDHFACVICKGNMIFYNDDVSHYDSNRDYLRRYLQEKYAGQNITSSKIEEVLEQVRLQLATYSKYEAKRSEEYIVCGDKLVSMWNDKELDMTRTIVTDVVYPYKFMSRSEWQSYNGPMKKFLDQITCGNKETYQALTECLGCMLAPVNDFGKIFIWYGSGANGKSLLLKLMGLIMGHLMTYANVLNINDSFGLQSVIGGICNVTDDVGVTTLHETGLLKSIVDGAEISVNIKNKSPINWKPNSQFVMCCNEIPRIADTTQGMTRRLAFIPFDMKLRPEEVDRFLYRKLSSDDEAMSYLMTCAIRAFRAAFQYGDLIETEKQKELKEDFKEENRNEVEAFLEYFVEESCVNKPDIEAFSKISDFDYAIYKRLVGMQPSEVYDMYVKMCEGDEIIGKPKYSQRAFLRTFNKLLPSNITTKVVRVSGSLLVRTYQTTN